MINSTTGIFKWESKNHAHLQSDRAEFTQFIGSFNLPSRLRLRLPLPVPRLVTSHLLYIVN